MSILTHTVQVKFPITFTDHTGISFVNTTTAETAVPSLAAPLYLTSETSPSNLLTFNNVEWVVNPVAGDVVEARYDGLGNYLGAAGNSLSAETVVLFNCLENNFAWNSNSATDAIIWNSGDTIRTNI